MAKRDDQGVYHPLLVEDSSEDDNDLLEDVNRTLGDGAPCADGSIQEGRVLSAQVHRRRFSKRKRICRRDDHLITNILCVICILVMLGNIIAVKFAVKYGIDWLKSHPNHSLSQWVNSKINDNQPIPADVVFSLTSKERLVHLDLKGAPPKLQYLLDVIPLFSQLGATGILIEYEDMFPFHDTLELLASGNAYSNDDITSILQACKKNNLTVIPLVQTFGHMEYVLKYDKYRSLRLLDSYPNYLNPALPKSEELVFAMVDQILSAHPKINDIHIGCDEVKFLPQPVDQTYLQHVVKVAEYIKNKRPAINVIIWDDVLRKLDVAAMKEFKIAQLVQPMVWVYLSSIEDRVSHDVWAKYADVFPDVWLASAFKGTGAPWMYYTDIEIHISNHQAWQRTLHWLSENHPNLEINGLALTGWSRYDHFGSLSEPLPVSIPSLAVCLQMVIAGRYNETVLNKSSQMLGCDRIFPVHFNDSLTMKKPMKTNKPHCSFPGYDIYKLSTFTLRDIMLIFNDDLVQTPTARSKGWLNDYALKQNFSSPYKLNARVIAPVRRLRGLIKSCRVAIQKALAKVFFDDMIDEWMVEYIEFITDSLDTVEKQAKALMERKVWPRRPLT